MVLKASLRFKLIVFSLVICMLPVLFAYFLLQQNISKTRDQLLADSTIAARLSHIVVDNLIINTKTLLLTLGRVSLIRTNDREAISHTLQETVASNPTIVELFIADAQGNVVSSAEAREDFKRITDWPEFQALAAGQNASVTGSRTSSAGTSVAYVLVPFRESSSELLGVGGAAISLELLESNLKSIVAKKLATIDLFDSQGTILVRADQGENSANPHLKQLLGGNAISSGEERSWMDYSFADGKPWLRNYAIADSVDWGILVSLPSGVGYPTLRNLIFQELLPLLFVSLLAIFWAIVVAQKLSDPLYKLTVVASSMAKGELGRQVQVNTGDEIEELANVFNYMSRSLAAHLNELTEAKAEITRKASQLSELLARTFRWQEEDRNRIAVDLHDSVTQLVVGALYELQSVERGVVSAPEEAARKVRKVEELLNHTIEEMRSVIFDLHPSCLYHHGLVVAIEKQVELLTQTSGIFFASKVYGEGARLPIQHEIAIYRIVQESLNNVMRHSEATAAYVVLTFRPDGLRVTVQDNGKGFDKEKTLATADDHLGLVAMQERAQSIGGHLEIVTNPSKGTKVFLDLPFLHDSGTEMAESRRQLLISQEPPVVGVSGELVVDRKKWT